MNFILENEMKEMMIGNKIEKLNQIKKMHYNFK
jgi:hypothetical protein